MITQNRPRNCFFNPFSPLSKSFWFMLIVIVLLTINVLAARGAEPVLILYDSAGPYGQVGKNHSILLTNLLGHFSLPVNAKPVSQYRRGEMQHQTATFYIGATFEEQHYYEPGSEQWQHYSDFLADAAATDTPLIWLNYNLHLLQQMMDAAEARSFSERFGFMPQGTINNKYNRVYYKDTELFKGVVPFANPGSQLTGCIEEGDDRYACSPELNTLAVLDGQKAQVHALAGSTLNADAPSAYITQSGNFWFVGDLPFSYLSEEDRYLAFADILHDMLGIDHAEEHRALVRLEDVHAMTPVQDLAAVTEYLSRESIPFSIATIASYREPGVHAKPLWFSATGRYLAYLHHRGRTSIVAHGLTHQRDGFINPYNGISGDDFEFYRVTLNADNSLNFIGPFSPDTPLVNRQRMEQALFFLRLTGLNPFAWEAPHYLASENAYQGILQLFPVHYGRVTYFNNVADQDRPISFGLKSDSVLAATSPHLLGQFFPYVIHKDVYGYRIIPENIGNVEPEPLDGARPLFPSDLIRHAEKALVVRDGLASFYYHPEFGVEYISQVVEGLKSMGYTFVAPERLLGSRPHR